MSAVLDMLLDRARAQSYRGADADGTDVSFDDAVERAAMVAHRMGFETPETAVSMVTSPSGQASLATTWERLPEADRQLYRRRVAAVVETVLRGSELRDGRRS